MKPLNILCIFVFPLLLLALEAHGANSYSVLAVAVSPQIHEFSACRRVTNNRTLNLFVATKTSAEWSAFRSNVPSSVTAGYCYYNQNCRMEDTNNICQKTYTCPHGTVRRLKMVCSLEVNNDHTSSINSNAWNTAEVAGESESGYSCKIGSSSYSSGTTSLSSHAVIGDASFTYSCQDDDANGGDCSIYVQVECGD